MARLPFDYDVHWEAALHLHMAGYLSEVSVCTWRDTCPRSGRPSVSRQLSPNARVHATTPSDSTSLIHWPHTTLSHRVATPKHAACTRQSRSTRRRWRCARPTWCASSTWAARGKVATACSHLTPLPAVHMRSCAEQGRFREAIVYYEAILRIDPTDGGALNNMGGQCWDRDHKNLRCQYSYFRQNLVHSPKVIQATHRLSSDTPTHLRRVDVDWRAGTGLNAPSAVFGGPILCTRRRKPKRFVVSVRTCAPVCRRRCVICTVPSNLTR